MDDITYVGLDVHKATVCAAHPSSLARRTLSPMHEALWAGHLAQPSIFCMSRDGPPITQRTSGLVRHLQQALPKVRTTPTASRKP